MKKFLLIIYSCILLAVSLLGAGCEIAHVHTYKEIITAPTCTEQGYTTHLCECKDSYVDSYINALGHKFENYVSDNNATYARERNFKSD